MPKVTKAHLEARRKQILDAATTCFSRKGFHNCTMQDICKQAKLSPGALYRYFSGKEKIIQAMAEEKVRGNMALIEEIRDREIHTVQSVDALADAFFAMLDDPQACPIGLEIELWAEALRDPKIRRFLRKSLSSHREAFTEIIRQGQNQGEFNPDLDPEAVARVMIASFDGLLLQKGIDRKVDVGNYVAVLKTMMRGLFK